MRPVYVDPKVPEDVIERSAREAQAVKREAVETGKAAEDVEDVPRETSDVKMVVGAARNLPIVDEPWDAAGARGRLFEDPTFEDAKRGHFLHDADATESRSSYRLPFADFVEGRVVANLRGVRAAASRLSSTPMPAPVRRRIRLIIDGYLDRNRAGDSDDTVRADSPRVECGVRRYDRGTLRRKPRFDDSTGFLHVELSVTKAPAVFKYRNADGSIRREFRPAKEVFSADNVERMRKSVITLDHPPVRVTTRNVHRFSVGHSDGSKAIEGGHFWTGGVLQSDEAIGALKDGKAQTSAGYDCDLVFTPGVFVDDAGNRHPYDAIQTKHRHNHTALVDFGRAETTGVSLDRMDAVQVTDGDNMPEEKSEKTGAQREDFFLPVGGGDNKTARVTIDGIDVELPIEKAKLIADARKADREKADQLEAERDTARADLEAANAKLKDTKSEEEINARVDARRELLDKASTFVTDRDEFAALKSKSDDEIKRACVHAANPAVKLDGKSETYVEAMFDLLQPQHEDALSRAGKALLSAKGKDTDGRSILKQRIDKAIDKTDNGYRRAIPGGFTADGKTPGGDDSLHG